MNFIDIDKNLPDGNNMGGLAQTIIYGLHSDVDAWPSAPVAPADIGANAFLVGDVVMKTSKRAFTFYSTDDTAELKIDLVGQPGGLSFEMKLNCFSPGLQSKLLGFIAAAKNENLFFISQDNEGHYYLLGDAKRAVRMITSEGIGTGKATKERKGANLSFVFKTNAPRVYVGDVTTLISDSLLNIPANAALNDDGSPLLNDDGSFLLTTD